MEFDPVAVTNGLAAAGNLVNSLAGLAKTASERDILIEANNLILAAQSGALTLQQQHSALLKEKDRLEQELADLKDWRSEAQKYEPVEIVVGAFAYTKKQSEGGVSPRMYFCANCFERREKTILNQRHVPTGRMDFLDCPHCKATFMTSGPGVKQVSAEA